MSKRSKRRRKKRLRYLKKLARRQAQLEAISNKSTKKEVLEKIPKKEILDSEKVANTCPERSRRISQKIPQSQEKLPYLKKDLLKVIIMGGIFLIILVVLFLIDQKTGALLSLIL